MTTETTDLPEITSQGRLLWQSKNGQLHFCEGSEVHPGIKLIWTLCEKDVPANTTFRSWEGATCMECALAQDQRNLESMGAV